MGHGGMGVLHAIAEDLVDLVEVDSEWRARRSVISALGCPAIRGSYPFVVKKGEMPEEEYGALL